VSFSALQAKDGTETGNKGGGSSAREGLAGTGLRHGEGGRGGGGGAA